MDTKYTQCVKTLSEREKISAILWLIIGIIQVVTFVGVICGAWNIYCAVCRLKQSKAVLTPYPGLVKSYDKWLTNIIISLVINLVLGGVIGVGAAAGSAYGELVEYFRRFDPCHQRHEEVFLRLGYIDCQYLAPMIRAKVLFQTCMMDKACPPSTQYAAYNKITAEKEHVLFHDFAHEMPLGSEDISFRFFSQM